MFWMPDSKVRVSNSSTRGKNFLTKPTRAGGDRRPDKTCFRDKFVREETGIRELLSNPGPSRIIASDRQIEKDWQKVANQKRRSNACRDCNSTAVNPSTELLNFSAAASSRFPVLASIGRRPWP